MRRHRGLTGEELALWHHAVRDTAPLRATETLPIYAYRLAFEEFDFGAAAAACTVMFLVLVAGAVLYFRLFDPTREVEVGR